MKAEWKQVKFREVLMENTRNGIYKSKEFHGEGAKIVNMGELFAHPRLFDVSMRRLQLTANEVTRFSLREGDLMFARRSLTAEGAGRCSWVCEVNEPTVFESSIIRARPDPHIADSAFLYYWFNSPVGRSAMDSIGRQVAVAGITGTDLVRLEITLPPLPEQRAIARILSSLDDKIELNRRMNATLEALAQTLFRAWFVDFEPVKARAVGLQPAAMDAETAVLFPAEFETSTCGPIPEGWKAVTLDQLFTIHGGGTPKTSEPSYWNGDIPWFSVVDAPAEADVFVIDTEKKITTAGLNNSATKLLPKHTVIISARGTVGRLAVLSRPMAMNQSCYGLEAKGATFFTLYSVKRAMAHLKQLTHGGVFDTITQNTFKATSAVRPSLQVLEAFERAVAPLMQHIEANLEQSRTLADIRDSLLPRLISGQLRVPDALQVLAPASLIL